MYLSINKLSIQIILNFKSVLIENIKWQSLWVNHLLKSVKILKVVMGVKTLRAVLIVHDQLVWIKA
jgi:hypothetical protein